MYVNLFIFLIILSSIIRLCSLPPVRERDHGEYPSLGKELSPFFFRNRTSGSEDLALVPICETELY
jgi:hypothetical protein